jgi:hypothetical protein
VDDRRQRVRAKVNYFACVLSETFGKDVVTRIDMSRGGLGFRTKNAYAISAEVTVAVPFFAGIAERAGDLCAGAGSEYPGIAGIAGIENVPVWRGLFCPWRGRGRTPEENQLACAAAFLASAES